MALVGHALTSVANAKAHIGIPTADSSQDARLELLINAATQRIESITDRCLKERAHIELRSGRKSNVLTLKEWPVTAVTQLNMDKASKFDAGTIVSPDSYIICDDGNSIMLINDYFNVGYSNIRVSYVAGFNATDHAGQLADLEMACLWLVEWYYKHRERGDMGRTSKSKGDESVGILAQMPPMIREILNDYKRTDMPLSDRPVGNL